MNRSLLAIGVALLVIQLAGAAWSATMLAGGLADIPAPWWSTFATLAFAALALPLVAPLRRLPSRRR